MVSRMDPREVAEFALGFREIAPIAFGLFVAGAVVLGCMKGFVWFAGAILDLVERCRKMGDPEP